MPDKHFSDWLPEWAYSALRRRTCSQCGSKHTKKDVIAVGLREVESKHCAMYIEHKCPNCDHRAITTLNKDRETTLEGLCLTILESIKNKKIAGKTKELKFDSGPMTDKEVDNFLDFIQKSSSHEDFMREIGANSPGKDNDTS